MSALAWTLPTATPRPPPVSEDQRLNGRDILFHASNYEVGPHGDWRTVEGERNVKLAFFRRMITRAGEFKPFPGYGAGLRARVKGTAGQADLDEMANMVRQQALADPRIQEVVEAHVVKGEDETVRVGARLRILGRVVTFGPFDFKETF